MVISNNLVLLLFSLSVLIAYFVRLKIYLGPIDPLKLVALNEGVWVVTVYELASAGVATNEQAEMFAVCLLLWWGGWWYTGHRFGRAWRQAITRFWVRLADMPSWGKRRILVTYVIGLSVLMLVTLANGGGGDNRQAVMKLLRPMESVTTLLVPIVLFHLLVGQGWRSKLTLAALLLGMILTGGKSSILALLVPVTGAALIGRFRLRLRFVAILIAVGFIGFSASVMINYGVSDPLEALQLLYIRISLDGDVYLLSLTNDLLSHTETTSLTTYLLGPLIKLLFLPIGVDQSIGAQIGSLLRGEDSVNGPNPHWPIVLLAYHQTLLSAALLSLLTYGIVMTVKLRLSLFGEKRRWPLSAMIPLNAYVLLYPQTYFADPNFPMIYILQAGILAFVLSFVLKSRRLRSASRSAAAAPSQQRLGYNVGAMPSSIGG